MRYWTKMIRLGVSAFLGVLSLFPAIPALAADELPIVGTKTGQWYPDFLLPKLDGGMGRLSDYLGQGRKILLFHFASW